MKKFYGEGTYVQPEHARVGRCAVRPLVAVPLDQPLESVEADQAA